MAPGAAADFFILRLAWRAGRQSETAAAKTAISDGSAARQASSISLADSTRTISTPAGSGSWVGPLTSRVLAPARASAAAIAWPCLPDERLPMKRTGSIAS